MNAPSPPFCTVAIDGGAASGKSSTARGLSTRYHLLHVDTGSHYRALTHLLRRRGQPPEEGEALDEALADLPLSARVDDHHAVLLAGEEPVREKDLRGLEVNEWVSTYAALPAVRHRLLALQRWFVPFAREEGFAGVVMEGRDIGSVVLPDADLRFFLEADPDERAARRRAEGQEDTIADRDRRDTERQSSPLVCPEGATRIDTGALSLPEVIARVGDAIERFREKA